MAYIPDEKIDEIRAVADVVDVVGDYVKLKRSGARYVGLCPFHNEKTPSFGVTPSMGIYKCFGCGKGGDVFSFIRDIEGVAFTDAARMLAERFGIDLPEPGQREQEDYSEREAIFGALRFAARFFHEQLTTTKAGEEALAYLKDRGFTDGTIKRFGLGYAPDRWDGLMEAAAKAQIGQEALVGAGLLVQREGGRTYDRYRHRVIFPILSHVGKVLGFGGRILRKEEGQPKYVNTSETKVYHKSRVLYGLSHAKQAVRKREEAVFVEGYTDVISLHQAGVEHVVATSGTALTEEQAKLIGRYAKRLVLLYDSDAAGQEATVRGIGVLLAAGLAVYAAALPEGDDPDTYVQREGAEAFTAYLEGHRQDFVAFQYGLAERAGRLAAPEDRAASARQILENIAQVRDPLLQDGYVRSASSLLGMPEPRLFEVLREIRLGQQRQARRAAQRDAHREARQESQRAEQRAATPRDDGSYGEAPPAAPHPADDDDFLMAVDEFGEPHYDEARHHDLAPAVRREPSAPRANPPRPEEVILLKLMLEEGRSLVEYILGHTGLGEFTEGPSRQAAEALLAQYQSGEPIDRAPLTGGEHGEAVQALTAEALTERYEVSENWKKKAIAVPRLNEDPYLSARGAMINLKLDRIDEAIGALQREQLGQQQRGEDYMPTLQRIMDLQRLRPEIDKGAFLQDEA